MSGWTLHALAKALAGCRAQGEDVALAGIAIDSRAVRPGELFAALPGTFFDGRDFVDDALASGAIALLLPAEGAPPDLPCLLCEHPRRAAGQAAQLFAGDPSAELDVIGVTGTNGKSSCVQLLQTLLSGPERSWGLVGTLRFEAGDEFRPSTHTTPDPVQLAELLAANLAAGRHGLAMEVSSHALDQDRVAGVRFAGALLTNISRDHLDYHGDMASYLAAKLRLLELRSPGAPALLNRDDERFAELLGSGRSDLLSFGRSASADYRVTDELTTTAGSRFTLAWSGGELRCETRLPGAFNVSNAAGCLALALALGEDPAPLAGRLAAFAGVPGRMERIQLPGGPDAIVDFAHTPDAVTTVLAACRPLCRGRLVALLGAGGDRDRGKRPLMGAALQAGVDMAVLTSDNPRGEDPGAILAEMETGMDPAAGSWLKEVDRARAIRTALALCREGDMIVVLGKGHEETQEIAGRLLPFSDREEILAAWRERGGEA